jgi:hypothetical protein
MRLCVGGYFYHFGGHLKSAVQAFGSDWGDVEEHISCTYSMAGLHVFCKHLLV